jgi:hypothetical protein
MNELKEIDDYTYKVLVLLLLRIVPEYKTIFEQNYSVADLPDEGVYLFMNEFATGLAKEIKKDKSSSFVQNAFSYINIVGERNNLEILNIVRVGILEILYTEKDVNRDEVNEMLSEKLKRMFSMFSKYYN